MRFTFWLGLVFIIGFVGFGYMHEQVHVQIMKSYGVNSHVEYFSHFPDFVTISDSSCPTDSCILANNINDVVGYHLGIFYVVFGILGFSIVCYKKVMFDLEKYKLEKQLKLQ